MDITTSIPGSVQLLFGALFLILMVGLLTAWARGGRRDDTD